MSRKWGTVAVGLFLLALVPFFIGCFGAHPATDDFTFALYTHPTWVKTHSIFPVLKDGLSYALRTWRDWQGTVTGVLVMTLNPAVFSLPLYGLHAAVLILFQCMSWLLFCRHFFAGRLGLPKTETRILALTLTAMSLLFLPDMVEGLYWFNGAWFYMGAQAGALCLLTLSDRWAGKLKIRHLFLGLGFFALGLDNYITAMMGLCLLLCLGLAHLRAGSRQSALSLLLLLPFIFAGLFLSVIAPGNQVRMAVDGAHETGILWLFKTALWTLGAAFFYIGRFLIKTPLLCVLCLALPYLFREHLALRREQLPPIPVTLLGFYLVLAAMIFPHMYSSGYAGSGRVINMYHCYVLLFLPLALCLCRGRMKTRKMPGRPCRIVAVLSLLLCLCLGQERNYVKLIGDQVTGVQRQYEEQFRREYALCLAADSEDTVQLPAWQVQTVTGKPTAYTDETVWTNQSMADYFGVRAVRAVPGEVEHFSVSE